MGTGLKSAAGKHSPFKAQNAVYGAEFTIGAETGSRTIGIQLVDNRGEPITFRGAIDAYLSDDAEGDDVTATAPTTVAAGTDGVYIPIVTGKLFKLISEVDGDIDLVLTEAGAANWYLNLIMPDGQIVTSSVIEFAA